MEFDFTKIGRRVFTVKCMYNLETGECGSLAPGSAMQSHASEQFGFTPGCQTRHAVLSNRRLRHLSVDPWVGPPCGAAGTKGGKASAHHYRANFCSRLPGMSPTLTDFFFLNWPSPGEHNRTILFRSGGIRRRCG